MSKLLSYKTAIFFISLFGFLLWSRLYRLDILPAALTNDEAVYAIQAKSFALQGKTIDQQQTPFTVQPIDPMYAEWPAILLAPGYLLTNRPLLAAHLVPALLGVSLPFILAWLLYGIWKDKSLSIAVAVVATFNPLLWQFSRLSYDAFFSVWFYVLGGAILLNTKSHTKLWSIPIFIFGFFQYQGFKLILLPWILLLLALQYLSRQPKPDFKKVLKEIKHADRATILPVVIVVLSILATLAVYGLVLLPTQDMSRRLNKTIFTDIDYLSSKVNDERRLSLESLSTSLFANKPVTMLSFAFKRFAGAFSPLLLFIIVEPAVSGFAVWTHGIFYWLEGIFILVGVVALLKEKKHSLQGVLLVLGVIALCFPIYINTASEWYILRTMMSYLVLIILAAWGLMSLWQFKILRVVIIGWYCVSIAYFSHHYWNRYPVMSLDWSGFDERVIARYVDLHLQSQDSEIVVYSSNPDYFFKNFLLYTEYFNKETANNIATTLNSNQGLSIRRYTLGAVTFTNDCVKASENVTNVVEIDHKKCEQTSTTDANTDTKANDDVDTDSNTDANINAEDKTNTKVQKPRIISISAVLDSGTKHEIYNDKVCEGISLSSFMHLRSINELNLSKISNQEFCSYWLTNKSSLDTREQ